MPDLQNFSVTRNGNVTVSVPRYTVTCKVVNSQSGEEIRDLSINFPNILANVPDENLDELFKEFITMIIQKRIERNI
jgi:hypothetical protein